MEQWESDLVARVSGLARTDFAARAATHDREGSFPAENVDELRALGITRMTLAPDLGGLGISAEGQMRIIEEIAYGDGSTAVALNMHLLITDFLTLFPPFPRRNAVISDIAGNGALICGPGSVPTGEVDNRRSGYIFAEAGDTLVVNGRAGFASMSEGAKYAILGGIIDRGEGNPPDTVVSLPALDTPGLTVAHNWDAMGLRGTASHDIIARDAAIPRSEVLVIPSLLLRAILEAGSQASTPQTQSRARGALGIAAIWLGLAQAAFDFTTDYVKQRHGYLAGAAPGGRAQPGYRADQPWAQIAIGHMDHWLETGRTVFYDTVRRLETPFPDQQAFIRHITRTIFHLRRMGEEVAQGAMRVCGAHAYVRDRPMERIFRDMVGGNVMAWKTDELQLSLGQAALGMAITFTGPAGT